MTEIVLFQKVCCVYILWWYAYVQYMPRHNVLLLLFCTFCYVFFLVSGGSASGGKDGTLYIIIGCVAGVVIVAIVIIIVVMYQRRKTNGKDSNKKFVRLDEEEWSPSWSCESARWINIFARSSSANKYYYSLYCTWKDGCKPQTINTNCNNKNRIMNHFQLQNAVFLHTNIAYRVHVHTYLLNSGDKIKQSTWAQIFSGFDFSFAREPSMLPLLPSRVFTVYICNKITSLVKFNV